MKELDWMLRYDGGYTVTTENKSAVQDTSPPLCDGRVKCGYSLKERRGSDP